MARESEEKRSTEQVRSKERVRKVRKLKKEDLATAINALMLGCCYQECCTNID